MKRQLLTIGGAVAALGLAACTAGQTGPPNVTSANISATSALQLAVGTANIAGTPGMNVVTTFRQPNGLSAVLVSTPKLTGPFTLPAPGVVPAASPAYDASATAELGPSVDEVKNNYIGGSPQVIASATGPSTPFTTFGTSGGVFATGFAPANSTSNGTSVSLAPYQEPLYANGGNSFTQWGGPPAFDPAGNGTGTTNGTFNSAIKGVTMGLNVFQGVTANAGTYTLNVNVPSGGAGTNFTASSTVASATLLPTLAAPVVSFDAADDATVTYTLPAIVSGAYVQVIDTTSNLYFTFWVTASGSVTVTKAYGPSAGTKVPIASGDAIQAFVIGFDYNHYGLTDNGKLGTVYPQKPAIPAQADVTISPPGMGTAP